MTKFAALGVLALAGLLGLEFLSSPARGENAGAPVQMSVIELFTSQGCSSCPPADRLLKKLSERPDVIALTFPVTYWDYLGWKDTLARPENAERQRRYAAIQSDIQVYTPEAVVNGLKGCVGSDLSAIDTALKQTAPIVRRDAVPLTVRMDGGRLIIETGAAPPGSKHKTGKVWVAAVRRSSAVSIHAGENSGNKVTYTNVVRGLTEAGEWEGAPTSYAVPLSAPPKDGDMFAVFLQMDSLGPIVAAARIDG
ncbi:MAG: DUF1223 domain-containing protein [Rhodomicrobium sp.]